jgi:uncharacterized protein (TIGR02147 family)
MKTSQLNPAEVLKRQLEILKKQNSQYSMRALARDLDMSVSFVSELLKGKRPIPKLRIADLKRVLKMDVVTQKLFDQSIKRAFLAKNAIDDDGLANSDFKSKIIEYSEVQRKKSSVYNHWYNIAISDLVTCKDVDTAPKAIADRLNISTEQVRVSLTLLEREGFIVKKGNQWEKASEKIRFATTHSMESIRSFHGQMIDLAKRELTLATTDEAFNRRLINGVTMAVNPAQLEKAKTRLNDALCEIAEILTEGDCTQVYQLNCQLFPLTK